MDPCNECLKLKQRLRRTSEYCERLSVQHDGMLRDGNQDAAALDSAIRQARHRRNAVGRLLLDHGINHEVLSRPKTRTAGEVSETGDPG